MAVSLSGALAAEVAAVWPHFVRRLVLLAPLGLFDVNKPCADVWAQHPGHLNSAVCGEGETCEDFIEQPETVNPSERKADQRLALEAAARNLFPTCNTGLAKRLHRIQCPLLLLRGSADRVITASCLDTFAAGVSGRVRVVEITDAGHLADLDQPDAVADAVREFLE